jgi:lipoprotein-anchoring transpeptidase ErfK/SrfK
MKKDHSLSFVYSCLLLALFFGLFTTLVLKARGETAAELASQSVIEEIKAQSGQYNPGEKEAVFNNKPVPVGKEVALGPERRILSAVSPDEKWIEVDLTNQKVFAHEGDRIVYNFPISSGKPWTPTVTGEFRVWIKLKYAKMSGGSRALGNYYYLPNVPFIMYFYQGYGIHGAYWHNNFGNPMSHGCVNMRIPDAEKIFYWADPQIAPGQGVIHPSQDNPGTRVVIHGKTPWR